MFNFIKTKLQKIYQQFTKEISNFFSRGTIDQSTLKKLEQLLITSDMGTKTAAYIINKIQNQMDKEQLKEVESLRPRLKAILTGLLPRFSHAKQAKHIFVLVGVNGTGKTTFIAKLAHQYKQEGKKILLVAADTFRAAAFEQLSSWAEQGGVDIVVGKTNQDPASVVFRGCQKYKDENYDVIIIDTAGRLQTKINLMHELAKIKRIIERQLPDGIITTLLTLDGMLGQNSLEQAKLFKEHIAVDGIVLTKMDGTGKGGIVFAIARELGLPIVYLSFGEKSDQCKLFNPDEYVTELLGN